MYVDNQTTELISKYLRDFGVPEPWDFELDDTDVENAIMEARQQHPEESPDEHKARGIARLAFKVYKSSPVEVPKVAIDRLGDVSATPINVNVHVTDRDRVARWIWRILVLLALLFLCAKPAHCQLDGLQIQDGAGVSLKQWAGGIAKLKCSTNLTCTLSGGVISIASSGGGSAHNFLSATHSDTTAASPTRGDIVTAQGASPAWTRLPKGTLYQILTGGANEPTWGAVALDQASATSGVLPDASVGRPASVVNASIQAGADMCAKISAAWGVAVGLGLTGAIVDARGFTGDQACAGSMWTNYPYAPTGAQATLFNGTLWLAPSVNIITSVSQVMPSGSTLNGFSGHSLEAPFFTGTGATIQPANGFATSTPIIEYGADNGAGSAPTHGIFVTGIGINCISPNGTFISGSIGIRNQFAQEFSGGDRIHIQGCQTGIAIEKGGTLGGSQNSGAWTHIHISLKGTTTTAAKCLTIGTGAAQGPLEGFRTFSCIGQSTPTRPLIGVAVDQLGVSLEDFHIENVVTGVQISANRGAGVMIKNIYCLISMTTCVDISNATTIHNVSIEGITAEATVTNLLVDNNTNGGTIPYSTQHELACYFRDQGNNIRSCSSAIASTIPVGDVTNAVSKAAANTGAAGMTLDMAASTSATAWKPPAIAGADPSTTAAIAYDTTQQAFVAGAGASAVKGFIPRTISVQAPASDGLVDDTITTVETAFATTYTIPTTFFNVAGKTLRFTIGFDFVMAASSPTAKLRVRLTNASGTRIFEHGGALTTSASSIAGYVLQCTMTGTAAAGASVNVVTSCASQGTMGAGYGNDISSVVALPTNGAIVLVPTLQYGSNPANTHTTYVRSMIVEELY